MANADEGPNERESANLDPSDSPVAADADIEKPKVPIEEWIPHPVSDSSVYLARRRGPWPKWTPPARD